EPPHLGVAPDLRSQDQRQRHRLGRLEERQRERDEQDHQNGDQVPRRRPREAEVDSTGKGIASHQGLKSSRVHLTPREVARPNFSPATPRAELRRDPQGLCSGFLIFAGAAGYGTGGKTHCKNRFPMGSTIFPMGWRIFPMGPRIFPMGWKILAMQKRFSWSPARFFQWVRRFFLS